VSGSWDRTVRLWDAATGALQQTLEGHTESVASVAFSPESVASVAFSPDSKQIVSGSWDRTVRLWDAATGALQQTLEGHTELVASVAFSPDGKQVVSGSGDRTVRLWDTATGALQQTLEGHTDSVASVAFSPDGKLLPILQVLNHWIVEGDIYILWLPPDYRNIQGSATWNRNLVIWYSSGKFLFFGFEKGVKLVI